MPASVKTRSFIVGSEEKATPVMAYTLNLLAWGEVLTREAIRVSTWLRTQSAPQYITLHDSQVLMATGNGSYHPQSFTELHVPTTQIIAFHLLPPSQDPLDYDLQEPHRKMEPATALVGSFRFDGFIRMSTQTNLARYLDVTKETFTAIYEVEISQPGMPGKNTLRVPYVLLRRDMILFSPRPGQ